MAGVVNTARLSARLASRYAPRQSTRRRLHVSSRQRAAQNYTMPALSPTMTEGNIATWRVKEGDSYSAGDVILEIETDKATMDVEAQDEGKLFKITQPDGAKGVKVGQRIAVMAEEGDDLSSLEMPADDSSASASSGKEEKQPAEDRKTDSASPKQEASSTGGSREIDPGVSDPKEMEKPYAESAPTKPAADRTQKHYKYPLFPAVQQLLHEKNISDPSSIPATGPNGRLLKGDVLAYLGQINKDYPSALSARLTKLSHLDLTHTVAAQPTQPDQPAQKGEVPASKPDIELPSETEIAVPISLSAVIATQKRVQSTLDIFLPLSTFIARASELANSDLPARKGAAPSADELFNSVLGLDKIPRSSRGRFFPQISGISPLPPTRPARKAKKADIIDLLAPKAAKSKEVGRGQIASALGVSAGDNVFSVLAGRGEEERATEYLERLKMALEKEPGRLVL
ncbi:pyridoxine biosynthesis protein [Saxophila tyrrhenica]|uniref:Pyridoxine biosynthesis protein n=1 Tax=Saxophila tyrrhenica TaxID=1690608 RepID=A0AAV9PDH0_9PEZI|nr:pyridoxine biosynthesis protein [Saxophila tyrrhenica]